MSMTNRQGRIIPRWHESDL